MKLFQLVCTFLLLNVSLFAQRKEIPKSNIDNSVGLKIVFQKYEVVSRYSVSKEEFPILKINDTYLPNDQTGFNKATFKTYLSKCPPAIKKANLGFDEIDKSKKISNIGFASKMALFGVGAFFLYKGIQSQNSLNPENKNFYIGGGFALGGVVSNYLFWSKATNHRDKGVKLAIEAIDLYNKDCFKPSTNDTLTAKSEVQNNKTKDRNSVTNGQSNENEKIKIIILENDPAKAYYGFSLGPEYEYTNTSTVNANVNAFYFKDGFYFDGGFTPMLSLNPFEDEPRRFNYVFGADATIPIIKSIAKKKIELPIGKAYNINFSTNMELKRLRSIGIDLGAKYHNYQINFFESRNILLENASSMSSENLYDNSIVLTIGPSYNYYSNAHYKIDDNRFSNKVKKGKGLFKAYAHALYNLRPGYKLLSNNLEIKPTNLKNIGAVAGIDLMSLAKVVGLRFNLEAGLYPSIEELNRFGGKLGVGFLIGK